MRTFPVVENAKNLSTQGTSNPDTDVFNCRTIRLTVWNPNAKRVIRD